MSDGVRNGGSVFAGSVDPKQSETYLSVRKILVHKMMPANPPSIDDDERAPSFSTVLSGVNESLDDLCKNMRWRAERLQDTGPVPGATRASFPGPRASPAPQLMARVAEEGPNNQYPNRSGKYAAAPALEPRANSDGRLPPLKQLENGQRGEGGSHLTTRSQEMAPPSSRSAVSSVIQHDVWMSSRVSQLLQELDQMKDKMKPRLERGHKLQALQKRLDSMEQGRTPQAHSQPQSYANSHAPNSYANSHAPGSEVGHGGGSSLPSIHEREGGRGKGAAGKVLTPRERGGPARRGEGRREVASEGQEAPNGRVPAKKRQLNRGGVAVYDSGDEAAEAERKGGPPVRGGRRERGAGQRGGLLPIAAHPVRRK